jgi:HD domain
VGQNEGHWRDHRVLAALVRLVATIGPLAAGIGLGLLVAVALPAPESPFTFVGWWALVLAVSGLGLRVADRLARRLLPLAVLLELSLLFPEQAPSRFKAALAGGSTKHLHEHMAAAEKAGIEGDTTHAAEAILSLVAALGAHHRPSRKHSERVRAYTELVAEELDLPERDRHRLRWAALLHDVGKVHVPLGILEGTGQLSEEAWQVIQRHPSDGGRLIAPIWDWLGPWAPTVEQHHERFDGKGYPHGLKGDDICLGARIVAVSDSFEAMTAKRSYQEPMTLEAGRTRLTALAGSQLDPTVVRAFMGISIKRLRWAYGPLAWLVEAPLLVTLGNLAPAAATAGARIGAAAAGVAMVAAVMGATPDTKVLGESFTRRSDTPTGTIERPAPETTVPTTIAGAPAPPTSTTSSTSTSTSSTTTTLLPPTTVTTPTLPPITVTVPTLPPVTVTVPTVPKVPTLP